MAITTEKEANKAWDDFKVKIKAVSDEVNAAIEKSRGLNDERAALRKQLEDAGFVQYHSSGKKDRWLKDE